MQRKLLGGDSCVSMGVDERARLEQHVAVCGNGEMKCGAAAFLPCDLDAAAHDFHQAGGDGQAQADAAIFSRHGVVCLVKLRKWIADFVVGRRCLSSGSEFLGRCQALPRRDADGYRS
jgi:hypothetical protein